MFTPQNREALFHVVVTTDGVERNSIPYATRQKAQDFLSRMLVKFEEYTKPITTDLNQLAGISINFHVTKNTYMIKAAK